MPYTTNNKIIPIMWLHTTKQSPKDVVLNPLRSHNSSTSHNWKHLRKNLPDLKRNEVYAKSTHKILNCIFKNF